MEESMSVLVTWGRGGTRMHYGKNARSQRRQCDALVNVLLGNLGSCCSRSCYFDMFHLSKHLYRPSTTLCGNFHYSTKKERILWRIMGMEIIIAFSKEQSRRNIGFSSLICNLIKVCNLQRSREDNVIIIIKKKNHAWPLWTSIMVVDYQVMHSNHFSS